MGFIQTNIKHLRAIKDLSQEELAEELKWTRSIIGAYEEGRSEPSIERLIRLSSYTNIPIDILVKNDLRLAKDTSFIEVGNKRVLFPITITEDNEDLIEVVPVKASAGYLLGYDDPEFIVQLEKIKLPFLPTGKHRAFPIKGDSMLPMKSGSYVVGRFIEDLIDIKSGKTYIVITENEGMVYKRVYNQIEENKTLKLMSDNKNYEAYEVSIHEVLEIWEFTCSINTQEYEEHELKISSILGMFTSLGIELKSLKQQYT